MGISTIKEFICAEFLLDKKSNILEVGTLPIYSKINTSQIFCSGVYLSRAMYIVNFLLVSLLIGLFAKWDFKKNYFIVYLLHCLLFY